MPLRALLVLFFLVVSGLVHAAAVPESLSQAALKQTETEVTYDGRYFKIPYPGGDVPAHLGVCTDVIIRAYRALNIDLQKEVHEDMKRNFSLYPKLWGLKSTDTNIDHRRVPNLQVFFTRHGQSLPVSQNPDDYKTGDLVTWNLKTVGTLPHIGIVTDKRSADTLRPLIVHNIGAGTVLEDMLFSYTITGHYRYAPEGE
ncbi:MAG: DUF1287 domain-containing protein [Alphaproteobacteria bacterium]|nr:DUF1287 domain-containing protein [Alphaproteobacteria bacterium]QQS56796.1 MAG: DUF1287 domain-containing protein [Alphaproteobacteria bacterium]